MLTLNCLFLADKLDLQIFESANGTIAINTRKFVIKCFLAMQKDVHSCVHINCSYITAEKELQDFFSKKENYIFYY